MKRFLLIACCLTGFAAAAQDTTYKEMVGKYKFPAGSIIDEANVTLENAVLTMSSSAGTSVLERIKGDSFNVVTFSGTCVFKRNEANKVTGVHVDASGYILDGVKDASVIVAFITTDHEALDKSQSLILQEALSDGCLLRRNRNNQRALVAGQ
jgi:hypothetical protein